MALTVIKPSGLDLTGNFTVANFSVTSNLAAGNLKTDNILYANGSPYVFGSGTPGGANTQVQFNDANSFAGSANLTFNKSTNTLSVTNIVANGSGLTDVTGANITGAVAFATTANSVALANVSGVGNIASINVNGNSSQVLYGNGTFAAISISSVANANYADQSNTANTVISSAQPNITSVGTLTTLSVTGNANIGNIGATNGVFTNVSGNGSALTSLTGANVTGAVSYATVANSVAGANVTGEVGFAAVANSISLANVSGIGNIASINLNGNGSQVLAGNGSWVAQSGGGGGGASISNGTSNVNIPAADGNITFGVNGNANVMTVTSGSVVMGNGVGGSIIDLDLLVANYVQATLNANSAAQPNITSLGSLSSLVVSGNATVTGNLIANTGVTTFGSNTNIRITGGTSGHFLRTDGAGNLTWASGTVPIAVDNSSNATYYPIFSTVTTGSVSTATIANSKLQFNPSSGQLTVTDLNTTSDMTLKSNVQQIEDPMAILNQLTGFMFNWKNNGKKSYGVMAQLLEKILPELVNTNAQGEKTVNYLPLIAFLIEGLKSQQKDIDILKKKLDS